MGDAYLQRPEADGARVAAPAVTTAPVGTDSQLGQAAELGGGAPGLTTAAGGQAAELVEPDGAPPPAAAPPAPEAPPGGGPTYTVVRGDTLAKISRQHYQAGGLWRGVYQANEAVIGRNPHLIEVGMQLTLPTLDQIIATCDHRGTVEKAFEARWGVSVTRQAGAVRMPVDTFRRVHAQLLLLPRDQVEGTWTKLVHANNSRGAYMSHDGEFGLGEDAAAVESGTYGGAALSLMEDAAAGATELHLAATSLVGPGVQLTVGEGEAAETVTIKAVNGDRTVFTVDPPLTRDHAFGEAVAQTNNRERTVQWLEAAVRHEMGHAVDNRMGSVTGLTEDLGGWHSTTDFDTWAALMGDPWATSDGTEITADERQQIKARIERLKTTPTTAGLGDGLAADHAIMKFWNLGVPVIEAARPMAQHGSKYWKSSGDYYGTNGHFFTINDYYGEFHAFSPEVQYNQVRGYATYSPAEFFAELYTVYYEEAGTEGADLGRLIPVASWRTWMTENVHNAHHGPEQEGE